MNRQLVLPYYLQSAVLWLAFENWKSQLLQHKQGSVTVLPEGDGSTETSDAHVHARVCKVREDVSEEALDVFMALQGQGPDAPTR